MRAIRVRPYRIDSCDGPRPQPEFARRSPLGAHCRLEPSRLLGRGAVKRFPRCHVHVHLTLGANVMRLAVRSGAQVRRQEGWKIFPGPSIFSNARRASETVLRASPQRSSGGGLRWPGSVREGGPPGALIRGPASQPSAASRLGFWSPGFPV